MFCNPAVFRVPAARCQHRWGFRDAGVPARSDFQADAGSEEASRAPADGLARPAQRQQRGERRGSLEKMVQAVLDADWHLGGGKVFPRARSGGRVLCLS